MRQPTVYILASHKNGTLYIGVTSDLIKRVYEHKNSLSDGFTKKYKVYDLVYFEQFQDMNSAIEREKQLKAWKRQWKTELIEKSNVNWQDLYDEILGVDSKSSLE
ncbi:MAG: GIY-YIG nuclease family protein [Helicobacteraceae bacterium]|nr:GIY-YIG nuclease family protein [Helicobacteraceae bacterium]